jgi:hypothetical protein
MSHNTYQSKVAVRLVFAAVVFAYATQLILVRTLGTPYPAIMMPEFRGSGGYQNGKVYVKRIEAVFVTREGETISFTRRDLLSDFPGSHHDVIANCFLSPLADSCTPVQNPPNPIIHLVFPGLGAGSLHRTAPENIESLRSWALDRARQLLPRRTVKRVEFRWYQEILQNVSGQPRMERKPDGAFVIRLAPRSFDEDEVAGLLDF